MGSEFPETLLKPLNPDQTLSRFGALGAGFGEVGLRGSVCLQGRTHGSGGAPNPANLLQRDGLHDLNGVLEALILVSRISHPQEYYL